ncbi:MAG: hypothetical protein ACRYG7_41875 [Janthinobacterium lividum]
MRMQTKYRTFDGSAPDGFAGFRTGQRYLLRCTQRNDGQLVVEPEYPQPGVKPAIVSEQQFEQWWRKG